MTAAGKFYTVRTITAVEKARFGPFYGTQHNALKNNMLQIPFRNKRQATGMIFDQLLGRVAKFPGVAFIERPAHARITFPGAAAITDHSTLQLVDADPGNSGAFIFEFKKVGPSTPGNVEVDISGATTGATVAAAFMTAFAAYLLTAPVSAPSGFIASRVGTSATVDFLQAFIGKNGGTTSPLVSANGTWLGKTWGSYGNTPVALSVPGEWTNLITGFAGGKARRRGLITIPEHGGKPRAQVDSQWLAAVVPPVEIG